MTTGRPIASIVIPALNEEVTIGALVDEIQTLDASSLPVDVVEVIVVDNGSTDATAERARAGGARVIIEPVSGYGRACLAGARAATGDLLVFMDGDRSEVPAELPLVAGPVARGEADLVLGSRVRGHAEPGALSPQQLLGNQVATVLFRLLFGLRLTDVGPYRAIRRETLLGLGMRQLTYGWPVEMIARAARRDLRIAEIPVSCRRRGGGESKVSGNLKASVRTAYRMLSTILRIRLQRGAT